MAFIYVSNDAGRASPNTSPYDTWDKAATLFSTGLTQASVAGDTIYMDSTDTYNEGAQYNPDFSAGTNAKPIKLISSTFNTTNYAAGAAINPGNFAMLIAGAVEMYGMTLKSDDSDLFLCDDADENQSYFDCTITAGSAGGDDLAFAGNRSICRLVNCTITADGILGVNSSSSQVFFIGCNIQSHGVSTDLLQDTEERVVYIFESCDLTDWTTLVSGTLEDYAEVIFRQCQLRSAGHTLNSATLLANNKILLERSSGSTNLTVPKLGIQEYEDFYGTISSNATLDSIYRTGGANDGEQTGYSYKMVANTNTLEFFHPLRTPWFVGWIDGGAAITLTFHVASGVTLQDDEFWIELITPDETATSTTQADYRTSRLGSDKTPLNPVDPLATSANLTTDSSSTWNGSGVGTKQEISFTFTPDIAGPIKYRACLAKAAGETVYFDPKYTTS